MKKLLKLTSIFLTIVMCVGLFANLTVFAKEDLVIRSDISALGSGAKYNITPYEPGDSLYGYVVPSNDVLKKYSEIADKNVAYYNFEIDSTQSPATLNEYSYLISSCNFATENIETLNLETASSKDVSAKITSDKWESGKLNNIVFVCEIDKTNTDNTKVKLSKITYYLNGNKGVSLNTTSYPYAINGTNTGIRMRLKFDFTIYNEETAPNGVQEENTAVYLGNYDIYATDTLPTISMPEFMGLDYTTNVGASHKGNKIQANTTTAQAIRSASTENYIVNAFASNNFTTPLADDYVLQLGDVITVQDVANNKISYFDNVITDGTYVFKEGMATKWNLTNVTDLGEGANTNIALNEETQTAAKATAEQNAQYMLNVSPDEIWDYFIAEYDVLQLGNTKHVLATNRGHSISGASFYLPEAEWCHVQVVFDLVNRVSNTYVDGVIKNPDYKNTTIHSTDKVCHFDTLFDPSHAQTQNQIRVIFENKANKTDAKVYIDNMKLWFSNTAPAVTPVAKPAGLTEGLNVDDTILCLDQTAYTVDDKTPALTQKFENAYVLDANFAQIAADDTEAVPVYLTFKNDNSVVTKTYILDSVKGENFFNRVATDKVRDFYACTPKESLFIGATYTDHVLGPVTVENVGPTKFTKLSGIVNDELDTNVKFMLWDKESIMPIANAFGFNGTITE